jgi:FkbM family methyltransferase
MRRKFKRFLKSTFSTRVITELEKRLIFYKKNNINFKKVLDIGAYKGEWKDLFQKIFPESDILMIEANKNKEDILKKKGNYIIALLGSEDGKEVDYFKCTDDKIDTGNSVYLENTSMKFNPEKRKTKKLSSLLDPNDKFDLIKIDVQGSEIEVIEGGKSIIKNSNFLLVELSLQNYNEGAPKLLEVINKLNEYNFELIDIIDRNYRNNVLVQIDGIFKNKDKDLINFNKLIK